MSLKVAAAQIAPTWLNKSATIKKALDYIAQAASEKCDLVAFGEAFVPGYPFWIELTDGARFDSNIQKELHAFYISQAVSLPADFNKISSLCKEKQIACVIGCIELAADRGGHSLYCTLVYIDKEGVIQSAHRKLMPTYEERLSWAQGDGHGLRVHALNDFRIGALNCWENWMPMARTALYAQGEDLHVAVWPGSVRNTMDITRFIAQESRSYVISVSSLLRRNDIGATIPHHQLILENANEDYLANGGSCIAAPDGSWVIEPLLNEEKLITAELDHDFVKRERQNFDPSGHYSRPDVLQLSVNRERQSIVKFS
jgi:nitrilase